MLHGSVVAHGFPTLPRGVEKRVEMSLTTIGLLAGIGYPVYLKGVTYLEGWTSLMYPMGASDDFSSIQWHLVKSSDPRDVRLKPSKAPVDIAVSRIDVDLDGIRKLRSFVGYCSNANIHLGTKSFGPQLSRENSGALPVKISWKMAQRITVSRAPNAMGFGGPTMGGEAALHKKDRAMIAGSQDFDTHLKSSSTKPVVLYDTSASTGWWIPEINVALHMARPWLLENGDLAESEQKNISLAPISEDGGSAAYYIIMGNRNTILKCAIGDKTWKFYDIVKAAVKVLHACTDTQLQEESSEPVRTFTTDSSLVTGSISAGNKPCKPALNRERKC